MIKLFSNWPGSFDKKIFKVFSFWLPWQPEFCMEWKGHTRTIPLKFGEVLPSGLGDVGQSNLVTYNRWPIDILRSQKLILSL